MNFGFSVSLNRVNYLEIMWLCLYQDFNPNPENYFKPIVPLKSSKPEFSMEYILEATGPLEPFPFDDETDVPVDGGFAYWIKQVFAKLISLFK